MQCKHVCVICKNRLLVGGGSGTFGKVNHNIYGPICVVYILFMVRRPSVDIVFSRSVHLFST